MKRTSYAAPDSVGLEAAHTGSGESRIQVKFDHGAYTNVESLTLPQAAALAAALRKIVDYGREVEL